MNPLFNFFKDRIQVNGVLIVLAFCSVLLLSSQSAASYPTYLLALAVLVTVRAWDDVFRVRIVWLILVLLTYLAGSSFWSDPSSARGIVTAFTRALLVFCFVIAFAECHVRGQVQRWLARALAVTGSLAAVVAMVVFVITDPEDGRLNGLGQLDTHVVAALVFGATLIFVLHLWYQDPSAFWRWLAVPCAIALLVAVGLSDSRNAWVSVGVGAGVFIAARHTQDAQQFLAASAAFAVVLVVLLGVLLVGEETRQLILPRGDSFRIEIWGAVVKDVVDNGLLFGRGILTNDNVVVGQHEMLHPHNLYLAVLFQGGLLGLGLFVMLLWASVWQLMAGFDQPNAKLALGVLGVALPAYLLDGHELIDKVGAAWFLLWLPVAIAVGVRWSRPSA